jgi:tRNA A22 N-methylase
MFKLSGPHGLTGTSPSEATRSRLTRLELVQRCVPAGLPHIDLATGHAQLLAQLASDDPNRTLCGTDKSRAEIESACDQLNQWNCEHNIQLMHTNEIPRPEEWGATDSFSLSATGLGGANMAELLLRNAENLAACSHMILQPNRDEVKVRAVLPMAGFSVDHEQLIVDRGYLYLVLVCTRISSKAPPLSQREILHGRWHKSVRQPAELRDYFEWHLRSLERKMRGEMAGHNWQKAEEAFRAYRAFQQIERAFFAS